MKNKPMKALIVRFPWIEKILSGEKSWELRGSNTVIRGKIALIASGSKAVFGVCELTDVKGPLSKKELLDSVPFHGVDKQTLEKGLPYSRTYAWVMEKPVRFLSPVPCKHPRGAVIWVNLSEEESRRVKEAVRRCFVGKCRFEGPLP